MPDLAISLDTRIDYIHDTQAQGKEEQHLKTKLSKVISKALGADKLVQDFDSIRHLIKLTKQQGKNVSHVHAHEHEVLRNQIHTKVIQKKAALKQELRTYEKEHFRCHGILPRQDTDQPYKSLVKQRNYVKWLLSTWDTTCS